MKHQRRRLTRRLSATAAALLFLCAGLPALVTPPSGAASSPPSSSASPARQGDLERLKKELRGRYAEIEAQFAKLRAPRGTPAEWRRQTAVPAGGRAPVPQGGDSAYFEPPPPRLGGNFNLSEWQAELAARFARAAATVEQILNLNPPDADDWVERLETLRLYAQPNTTPDARAVYGAREVRPSARLSEAPPADYTSAARDARLKGDVRLRLVLAADGEVRHVFPVKSLGHGLTESAVAAAHRIRFEPAEREGRPVSQFVTLVYEFKGGSVSSPPYVPKTIF